MVDNLIKLTISNGYIYAIRLKEELKKKGVDFKSEYRGCNFEQKAQMADIMFDTVKNEIENLKSIIKERNLQPNDRWYDLPELIKLLTYVNLYIVSLKAYLESLAKFITKILKDCHSSGLTIVDKIHGDKYKNLEYFMNSDDEINLIRTIREVFLHSEDKRELHIAFTQTENGNLELELIMAIFDKPQPSEEIMSYSKINQEIRILRDIFNKFYNSALSANKRNS
jgi:hypothetical protein